VSEQQQQLQPLPADEFKKKLGDACRLDRVEYLRTRQELASELRISVTLLDEQRKKAEKAKKGGDDTPEFLADPVLWDEPVDGSKLLNELTLAAKAHLVLPNGGPKRWRSGQYSVTRTTASTFPRCLPPQVQHRNAARQPC
jgi:hypothetical protein